MSLTFYLKGDCKERWLFRLRAENKATNKFLVKASDWQHLKASHNFHCSQSLAKPAITKLCWMENNQNLARSRLLSQ